MGSVRAVSYPSPGSDQSSRRFSHSSSSGEIAVGWAAAGLLAVAVLVIFRPHRLAEAAAIIGEADVG